MGKLRASLVAAAAGCAAVLAFAGPAAAADWNASYDVWAEAGEIQAGSGPATITGQKSVDGTDGKASAEFPGSSVSPVQSSFICAPTGCAGKTAGAGASVDEAAGLLKAFAASSLLVGNPPDLNYGGDANVSAGASLDDAITLSQPATVVLKGTVTGDLSAINGDDDYLGDPGAEAYVSLHFGCTQPVWTPDGPRCDFGGDSGYSEDDAADVRVVCSDPDPAKCTSSAPTPGTPTPEPFAVQVSLPAGTSPFSAAIFTSVRMIDDGWPGIVLWEDGLADFNSPGSGVKFEIDVPDGVCATSDSGLLPIVGGSCAASDTTAPTTSASVDPKPNAAGWNNGPVTVTLAAKDDDDGSGVASISYSLDGGTATVVDGGSASIPLSEGVTTITYHATDKAGNAEQPKTLTVKDDETPPALSFPGEPTVDATSPDGAPVSYSVGVTDNLDPAPTLDCSPASGSEFPIGTTQVTCTATDAAGNRSSGSFPVVVEGAGRQLADLDGRIGDLSLEPSGIAGSFQAKLHAAASAFAGGDSSGACLSLGAFRNEVAAQQGKKLTGAVASELDAAAARIEAVLGC